MKFKKLSLALILSCAFVFSAVEAFSSKCWYEGSEYYPSFYHIFKGKRGDDIEFIKFCYKEGFGWEINRDTEELGYYIPNSAAKFGRLEALKFFINEGFRLDDAYAYDRDLQKTPLQLAAERGDYNMSKYLLDKGASPIKKDTRKKYDAYDYAKQGGSQRVIDLVGAAWRKWKGLSAARTEEYKKEIKNVNMNDYEKFKRMHNLGSFNANSFWGINRA